MNILIPPGALGKLNFVLRLAGLVALVYGCAATPRTIVLARGPQSADALLAAHLPERGRNITPYLIDESKFTSRHVIWVRDREVPHVHAKHDLVVMVLRGQGTLWLRDAAIPMAVGDAAVVPAGVPHWFVNTGDAPAAALAIFSPPSDNRDFVPVTP